MATARSCSVAECKKAQFRSGYCADHLRSAQSGAMATGGGTSTADRVREFQALAEKEDDDQVEFFLKSFIFDLGDNWKEVMSLQKLFKKRLADSGEGKKDLNPVMAADFLQKHGRERTALQRGQEIKDIDLDNNGRIAFIEYLLLHYKVMILEAYYKRTGTSHAFDLTRGGIGVVGVGPQLLDELFTLPMGLDPALAKAIEDFMAQKKARESKVRDLEGKAAAGGVRGLAAGNEIKQMESQDLTAMNKMEITLNAAKRRSGTASGDVALQERKKKEEDEAKAKADASKNRLKGMASKWETASAPPPAAAGAGASASASAGAGAGGAAAAPR
jgi:hypothetical protein